MSTLSLKRGSEVIGVTSGKRPRSDVNALEKQTSRGANKEGLAPNEYFSIASHSDAQCSIDDVNSFMVELMLDHKCYSAKPTGAEVGRLRNRFASAKPTQTTMKGLAEALGSGRTFMPATCRGGTKAENWSSQQVMALDFDNKGTVFDNNALKPMSPIEAIERCLKIGIMSGFWYETWSSSENRIAFRLVFAFNKVIVDQKVASNVIEGLLRYFPEADQSCCDLSRMFFGTRRPIRFWGEGNGVDANELIEALSAKAKTRARAAEASSSSDNALGRAKKTFDLLGLVRADLGENGSISGDTVYFENCPICGRHDCFRINTVRNTWRCYSDKGNCGGSAIDYLERTRGMSETEAVKEVLGAAGEEASNGSIQGIDSVLRCFQALGVIKFIAYDTRESRPVSRKGLPWNNVSDRPWEDYDDAKLRQLVQSTSLNYSKADFNAAFAIACHENKFDPFQELLESLPRWDGVHRCGHLGHLFLGINDDPYSRAVEKLVFAAILERTYKTNVKFDFMPVYHGKQGLGKSSFCKLLSLHPRFFSDDLRNIGERSGSEILQGRTIVEIAELAAFDKKKVDAIKAFISREYDDYRAPYAHFVSRHPRRCVLIGTTNSDTFLSDRTGNRRFLPIECGVQKASIDLFGNEAKEYFEQAWAEALQHYREQGACLILPPDIAAVAAEKQERATLEDPRVEAIRAWLQVEKRPGDYLSSQEVLEFALGVPRAKQTTVMVTDVRTILLNSFPNVIPCEKKKKVNPYGVIRVFQLI